MTTIRQERLTRVVYAAALVTRSQMTGLYLMFDTMTLGIGRFILGATSPDGFIVCNPGLDSVCNPAIQIFCLSAILNWVIY